jgi:hypothetical protein
MAYTREEVNMRISGGTHLLVVLQYPAWPELEFGPVLALADEEKNVRTRTLIGEAVVRNAHGGGGGWPPQWVSWLT